MADGGALATLYPVNEPESKKSIIRKAFEKLTLAGDTQQQLKKHAVATIQTTRQYGEAAIVGGVLGALHAADPFQHQGAGLDYIVKQAQGLGGKDGTQKGKDGALLPAQAARTVPIDGALALVGAVASLGTAHMGEDGVSTDARNIGAAGLAVFTFRKGADLMAAKMREEGKPEGGRVPSLTSLAKEALKKSQAHGEARFGADPIAQRAAELMGRG